MRLAIATLYTKDIEVYAKYASANKRAYCKHHGYDFVEHVGTLDPSRPPSWSKILLLQRLVGKYDWVLWTDADVMICNNIPLTEFVDANYDVVMCWDPFMEAPFCGDFLVSGGAGPILKRIYEEPIDVNQRLWEMAAFNSLYRRDAWIAARTKIMEMGRFTSFGHTYKSGFLMHLAAKSTEERRIIMHLMEGMLKQRIVMPVGRKQTFAERREPLINAGYTFGMGQSVSQDSREWIKAEDLLDRRLRRRKVRSFVELGVYFGGTSWLLSRHVEPGGIVIGVDNETLRGETAPIARLLYDKWLSQAGLKAHYLPVITEEAVEQVKELCPDGIDLLHVDADHAYNGVKFDFETYIPLLSKGGIMVAHDLIFAPDVRRAWDEISVKGRKWTIEKSLGIGVFERT